MSDAVDSTGGEDVRVRGEPAKPAAREQSPDEKRTLDINERIAKRRADAEKAAKNYGLPHAGEKVEAKTDEKPDPKAEAEKKAAQKPPELAALEQRHAEVSKKLDEAGAKLAEWDEIGEQVAARLDANRQYIARLEAALRKANVAVDPRDVQIMRYQEQLSARTMADERVQALVKQQEEAERQRALAAESEQRRAGYQAIAKQFPDLTLATEHGKRFWSIVYNGGNTLEPQAAMALAPQFMQQQAPQPAPRTLRSGARGGGDKQPQSPQDYADKWRARQRAV